MPGTECNALPLADSPPLSPPPLTPHISDSYFSQPRCIFSSTSPVPPHPPPRLPARSPESPLQSSRFSCRRAKSCAVFAGRAANTRCSSRPCGTHITHSLHRALLLECNLCQLHMRWRHRCTDALESFLVYAARPFSFPSSYPPKRSPIAAVQ